MRARLQALAPWRADALIALAALAEFLFELLVVVPAGAPHKPVAAAALVCEAAGLALCRRRPLAAAVPVFAGLLVLESLAAVYPEHMAGPYFATFAVTFCLGYYAGRRELVAGIALAGGALVLAQFLQSEESATGDLVFSAVLEVGAPVLIGRLLRGRALLNRALREKTEALERARAGAPGRAVADERTRIAGELHDVVAHSLSAMTVQATAARRLTAKGHAAARDTFAAVETTGREALDELRRLLGVLRREDAELALAPQPSLRHVRSLTRRARRQGRQVALRIEGEERELPAGVDLTASGVIQHALADAGRADVRYLPNALKLTIRDDGPSTEERDVIGMRERVLPHRGRLSATGHTVRATLPLDGHPVEPRPVRP